MIVLFVLFTIILLDMMVLFAIVITIITSMMVLCVCWCYCCCEWCWLFGCWYCRSRVDGGGIGGRSVALSVTNGVITLMLVVLRWLLVSRCYGYCCGRWYCDVVAISYVVEVVVVVFTDGGVAVDVDVGVVDVSYVCWCISCWWWCY